MNERPLADLIDTADPGWPIVLDMVSKATNPVDVLTGDRARCEVTLQRLQVTTRSPLGSVAYESGGILVDHGWVRILGGGHDRLPRDLATWNFGPPEALDDRLAGALLVADDVLGGFFAINGKALPGPPGHVFYFAPDSLEWEDLEWGYSDFLNFLFIGKLDGFYQDRRWPNWHDEVSALPGDRAFSIAPHLWAKGPSIAERNRRAIPIAELWSVQQDIRRQLVEQL